MPPLVTFLGLFEVIITTGLDNEKELPGAFLRRCIFHYIDFPDPPLMRKIIAVHHPHLDAKLLDQVLIKFCRRREQSELRKRPSTAELVAWISPLIRSGVGMDKIEPHIPFLGALLRKEHDVDALLKVGCPGRFPKSWQDMAPRQISGAESVTRAAVPQRPPGRSLACRAASKRRDAAPRRLIGPRGSA